jgi:acetyltransferase-like isoleucine patch superfamily enzyme
MHTASPNTIVAQTAHLHPGVEIGPGSEVADYVILGVPPRGAQPGELTIVIGAAAILRSHAVLYAGSRIGSHFQCGHACLIRERCVIGNNVSIGSHSVIEFLVRIADNVRIHSQAFIPEYSVLEEGCWIGPNVVLTNAKYPAGRDTKAHLAGVTVGRGARVGANSTLLPGVRLGEGCLVGAGSVVTRDVPAGVLVYGNPARVVKQVETLKYEDATEQRPYGAAQRKSA